VEQADALKVAWSILAVVVSLAEIVIPGFFLLPFGLGAAVAAIFAFAETSFPVQMLVFVVSSGVFFAALRPLSNRLNRKMEPAPVGATRLLYERGIVLDRIGPDDSGKVRIGREEWPADSLEGEVFEAGDHILVVEVRGTRVVVTAAPHSEEEVSS
jgi:membrane protein implicated in regulation of membrane protease activity